ncbi:MAG: ArsR family transcriptional regulator, partial [Candidatus Lokiarchaeota archaeon]|nr:ArsR family transcriptional regulator [Candidatus Lokiarchaeota archaeon]MBD3338832.1 ArsR family transcriptional regulator [Candidatus Lokiarchaeota archaeon]
TRLRLILILLIFRKLSLTKLSNLLSRTKAAVSRHLKKFDNLDLITITRRKARGSIDAKVYELNSKFMDFLSLNSKYFMMFVDKLGIDALKYGVKNDKLLFDFLKNIFEQIILYYDTIEDHIRTSKSKTPNNLKGFDMKSLIDYEIWLISDNQKKKYDNLLSEFKKKVTKMLSEDQDTDSYEARPYLIFHTKIPIKGIAKFDKDVEDLKKIFKSLD